MRGPGALSFRAGFDAGVVPFAHVAQEIGHPIDVPLDAAGNVAEGGGVVWPDQGEEVGKTGDLQAEIGLWPVRPLVLQPLPAEPADIDPVEGAGDGIEA